MDLRTLQATSFALAFVGVLIIIVVAISRALMRKKSEKIGV